MSFKLNPNKLYSEEQYARLLNEGKISKEDIRTHFDAQKARVQYADKQIEIQKLGPTAIAADNATKFHGQFMDSVRDQEIKDINTMVPNLQNLKQQASLLGPGAFDADGNISLDTRNAQLQGYQDAQKYKAYKEQILMPQLNRQLGTDLAVALGLMLTN
ncbi:MAG: hypothetical protein CMB76_05755 [Euryarchaeota archaeon]|nr:hypothetical protein [Euryarchaeota archaeon]|tara:strand:- start:8786 stop:9262 length:477 start_codon:yes stop_codon:yes gene_type:complete